MRYGFYQHLSDFLRDISKTDAGKVTKLDTGIFHQEARKTSHQGQ